jgi:hypothetical protein
MPAASTKAAASAMDRNRVNGSSVQGRTPRRCQKAVDSASIALTNSAMHHQVNGAIFVGQPVRKPENKKAAKKRPSIKALKF